MNRNFALITTFTVIPEHVETVLASLNKSPCGLPSTIYQGATPGEILCVAFSSRAETLLAHLQDSRLRAWEEATQDFVVSDWHRQIIQYVETAKSSSVDLQDSKHLQLRYIEVPRRVHADYLKWREETIFAHVRKQDSIDSFHAYHTLLSTEPGVLFLSGFSCAPAEYRACFATPAYDEIVREAGSRFIVNGEKGLYTKIYTKATI